VALGGHSPTERLSNFGGYPCRSAQLLTRRERAEYTADRTHVALDKDSPATRPVLPPGRGRVIALPRVGGLHHRYDRRAA
jgi:hypothetical protein